MKIFFNLGRFVNKILTGFLQKNGKLFCGFFAAAIMTFCMAGCTSEVTVTAKENGSVEITFNGEAGNAFSKLINSASGIDAAGLENGGEQVVVFDIKQIAYELAKNGFSDVKVESKNGFDLNIKMNDSVQGSSAGSAKKSVLFTSGLLKLQKGKLSVSLSPKKLCDFYNASDEEIVQFLDLLLAPVFNDEVMSEDEYLDTIGSFYGDSVSKEIQETNFKITLVNTDGKSSVQVIPLATLLSLKNEINF